jgi:hypothetical protein
MPFGAPDFSNIRKETLVHRLDDLAEASVRTFIPVLYDRLGDVVYFNGFESGILTGSVSATNPLDRFVIGYGCGYCSDRALVHVKPANVTGLIQLSHVIPLYATQTIGFSIFVRRGSYAEFNQFVLQVAKPEGIITFGLEVNYATPSIKITTDTGWVTVASLTIYDVHINRWLWVKFVGDISNHTWVRAMLNVYTLDLRSYNTFFDPTQVPSAISVDIRENTSNNSEYRSYFDNLIITINEPVSD